MLRWLLNLFPSRKANCISCDHVYAKEAMKEIWYRYREDDGTEGTSSVHLCEPCANRIAEEIEDARTAYESDFGEYEVDDDVKL